MLGRFIELFINDDPAAAGPEYEDLAAAVAATYAASAWRTAIEQGRRAPPPPELKKGREGAVLDLIMERSYPGEALDVSLARVSKAVQTLGFPTVNAFSVAAAYNTFPQLSEVPYEPRRKPR